MGNDQNQAAEVMEQQFENIVSVDDGNWGGIANHTLKAQSW